MQLLMENPALVSLSLFEGRERLSSYPFCRARVKNFLRPLSIPIKAFAKQNLVFQRLGGLGGGGEFGVMLSRYICTVASLDFRFPKSTNFDLKIFFLL